MLNRLERTAASRHSISDRNLPTTAERSALERRAGELRAALRPGDRAAMAVKIIEMFAGFPMVRMTERQAADTAASFVAEVVAMPTWVVERAAKACKGKATPFPPSAGEFLAACHLAAQEVTDELADLDRILTADVYHEATPDERARRKGDFEALKGELGWLKPFDAPGRARQRVEQEVEHPMVGLPREGRPQLSPEALAGFAPRAQVEEQAD